MNNKNLMGNLLTLLTMAIWATTYISTKVLLKNLEPMEILFYRFLTAYFILILIHPRFKGFHKFKDELMFIIAGITGVTLYYLLENVALKYTLASNVGLFIAMAPILTAILSNFFIEHGSLTKELVYGFIIAIIGVFLVIFNGNFVLKLNPIGDLLAISAAVVWAVYSIVLKKINNKFDYNNIYITRKIFFYGVLFMIPIMLKFRVGFNVSKLVIPSVLFNILFLSLIASALCFVMWNIGVNYIGAVKASNYIYIVPLITALTSVIVLHENITGIVLIGACFILFGLYISQNGFKNPLRYFKLNSKRNFRGEIYMETNEVINKCVLVIDSELPIGLIANTAAILGITLGYRHNCIIGEDVTDASNQCHMGITNIPIPILKATRERVKELFEEVKANYSNDVTIVDFSETAQSCIEYDDYISKVKNLEFGEFRYYGIGMYGPKKILNKLTGSMPLLR
jgi:drug/metabolite transporter (DMT)-like permease